MKHEDQASRTLRGSLTVSKLPGMPKGSITTRQLKNSNSTLAWIFLFFSRNIWIVALRASQCQGPSELKNSRGDILRLTASSTSEQVFLQEGLGQTWGIMTRNNTMSLKVRRSVTAVKLESRKMALEASPYGSSELATFSQMLPGTSALSFSVLYTAIY